MKRENIRSAEDALAYLLDCSLATVEMMAFKKTRPKNEYVRQISIAQTNYDNCVIFGSDISGTRGADVALNCGSVGIWAKGFES